MQHVGVNVCVRDTSPPLRHGTLINRNLVFLHADTERETGGEELSADWPPFK